MKKNFVIIDINFDILEMFCKEVVVWLYWDNTGLNVPVFIFYQPWAL